MTSRSRSAASATGSRCGRSLCLCDSRHGSASRPAPPELTSCAVTDANQQICDSSSCCLQVFCNALIPTCIAVLLARQTGGADVLLCTQSMRTATRLMGAFLGEIPLVGMASFCIASWDSFTATRACASACACATVWACACAACPLGDLHNSVACPQGITRRAVETHGRQKWGSYRKWNPGSSPRCGRSGQAPTAVGLLPLSRRLLFVCAWRLQPFFRQIA